MSATMKIAHVVGARGWGGMEARTLDTARWQADRGHDVLVITAEGGATLRMAAEMGLEGYGLDFDAPDKLAKLRALRRRLRQFRPTVIDFHTNRSFAVGVADICPLVRSRHNLRKQAARLSLPKAFPFDQIIATSEAERDQLLTSRAVRADRISVVGEWADERFFVPLPTAGEVAARRKKLGLAASDFVIGACGMLRPDNAFDALIRTTAALRERGVAVSCLIVGATPVGESCKVEHMLRRLALDLGVSDAVHFLGHRNDVPELLDLMDVTAVVSRHTAQTRVVPEAAARGRPVVGFSVGALDETVTQAETGLLVHLDDVPAFTWVIERLLFDPAQRARMGAAAARRAELNFRQAVKMEETLAAYRLAEARRSWSPASIVGVHPLSIVQAS